MNRHQLIDLCSQFAGAACFEKTEPGNILYFAVAEKKFAYFKTSEPEKWRFSLRVLPHQFVELTDQAGIKPARYMGRFHWISIVNVDSLNDKYLQDLVKQSYCLAVQQLPKFKQRRLGAMDD